MPFGDPVGTKKAQKSAKSVSRTPLGSKLRTKLHFLLFRGLPAPAKLSSRTSGSTFFENSPRPQKSSKTSLFGLLLGAFWAPQLRKVAFFRVLKKDPKTEGAKYEKCLQKGGVFSCSFFLIATFFPLWAQMVPQGSPGGAQDPLWAAFCGQFL